MKPYLHLLKQGFKEISVYSIDFLLGALQSIAFIGTTIFLWTYILPAYNGQTLIERTSYLLLANGISMVIGATRFRFGKDFATIIKNGQLSKYLLRPISPLGQLLSEQFGRRMQEYIIGAVSILLAFFTIPNLSVSRIPLFIFLTVCSFVIATALNTIMGATALWTTEVDGVMMTLIHLTRNFSGIHIPLGLFRETLGAFAGTMITILPFAAVAYTPAHILTTNKIDSEDITFVIFCVVWAIIMPLIASLIWKWGLKKYEATGA